jgi:hypothetical protein
MLIRLPIRDISKWGSNIYSYSKLSVHPLLNVVVDSSTIKLSGMPYVSVRVLLKSKDLVEYGFIGDTMYGNSQYGLTSEVMA